MRSDRLSTMESTVLGIIWQSGGCTTYAVMRELKISASTYYRDRAGTTYPIVERLLERKLIECNDEGPRPRQARSLTVTPSGLASLRAWLMPPIPSSEVSFTLDLIRLRFFFVGALSSQERSQLVEDSLASLEELLNTAHQAMRRSEEKNDHLTALAELGVVYETRARIEWLTAIRPQLESLLPLNDLTT